MRVPLFVLGSLILGTACGPAPASLDDDTTSEATSTLAADDDTQSGTSNSEDSEDEDSEDEDTGDMLGCGDGVPMPGELCYEAQTLEGLDLALGQLLVHDFDGDARLDLLATSVLPCPDIFDPQYARSQAASGASQPVDSGVGGLTWLLGPNTDFGPPIGFADSLVAPTGAGMVVVGGNADVLFAKGLYSLRIPGDGAGGFGPGIPIELPNQYLAQFTDLDGDGLLDVVGIDQTQIVAARSDGVGDFTIHLSEIGINAYMLRVVDLDGDPFPDLLAGNHGELLPIHGVGDGSFDVGMPIAVSDLRAFELADFDEDGVGDLALIVGPPSEYSLSIRLGSDAGFADPLWSRPVTSTYMLVGRFNGDAALDLAVQNSIELEVHLGDGNAGLGATLSMGIEYYVEVVEDLDGDGIDDLLGASKGHSWPIVVYLSNP